MELRIMSVENLDKIFQPKSIAVVGASERKGCVGAALMHNLIVCNGFFSRQISQITQVTRITIKNLEQLPKKGG